VCERGERGGNERGDVRLDSGCDVNKKDLSERDICTKFITPAVTQAGWDIHSQVREEVGFTKGRIIVRGKLVTRGKPKRADYILYYKPNIPRPRPTARCVFPTPGGPRRITFSPVSMKRHVASVWSCFLSTEGW
jgi:hypothetical protein